MANAVSKFVEQLFLDGTVRLESSDLPASGDLTHAVQWVVDYEPTLRVHWPTAPPQIEPVSLQSVIDQFYRAAQLVVYRELGEDEIAKRISPDFERAQHTAADSPDAIYTIDLILRFLPDLVRRVRAMSSNDPLLKPLLDWGHRWPLSSVGIPDLEAGDPEPVLRHPCLCQIYIDRVIEFEALDRLSHPEMAERVRGVLGAYPELSPKLYRHLNPSPDSNSEHVA